MAVCPRRKSFLASFSLTGVLLVLVFINKSSILDTTSSSSPYSHPYSSSQKDTGVENFDRSPQKSLLQSEALAGADEVGVLGKNSKGDNAIMTQSEEFGSPRNHQQLRFDDRREDYEVNQRADVNGSSSNGEGGDGLPDTNEQHSQVDNKNNIPDNSIQEQKDLLLISNNATGNENKETKNMYEDLDSNSQYRNSVINSVDQRSRDGRIENINESVNNKNKDSISPDSKSLHGSGAREDLNVGKEKEENLKTPVNIRPRKQATDLRALVSSSKKSSASNVVKDDGVVKWVTQPDSFRSNNIIRSSSYQKLLQKVIMMARVNVNKSFDKSHLDIEFRPGYKIPVQNIQKVLIVSTWRSGSTFLGDLLKSYPATFYNFEPLHMQFQGKHLQYGEDVPTALNFIKDIFSCRFKSHPEFMNYLRENQYVIRHNAFVWHFCSYEKSFCYNSEFVDELCEHLPLSVMKTVRLGLAPVAQLLDDKDMNLKVIHLVRDPRGTLHSRSKLDWCILPVCIDPSRVCNDLLTDLVLSEEYAKRYPDRFLLVRHEDLSLYPEEIARSIFKFIGFQFHQSVQNFLSEHTTLTETKVRNKNVLGTYSTFRNSQAIPFAWRDKMSFEQIDKIQKSCRPPMEILGYHVFESSSEYSNKNVSVLSVK